MKTVFNKQKERALLVGAELPGLSRWDVEDHLRELALLADTAGALVVRKEIARCRGVSPSRYIGRGKALELADRCRLTGIDVVIFDDDLGPAQVRNLEKDFGIKVIDRTELILDIFAQHARTREGKIQIELAQLVYLLPRLKRRWTHLSRQEGGIGVRGPGETQIEVDRRRVRQRIGKLTAELAEVRKHRATQRKQRRRGGWPVVSIIGYTNSGKSTLMNALTSSRFAVGDRLFATLDPATRVLVFPGNFKILLTDTVGFIRKLPHQLVEAFKATLEEVVQSDLLLHVLDLSSPTIEENNLAVNNVLKKLNATGRPMVVALNKADQVGRKARIDKYLRLFPGSVAISAKEKTGLSDLMAMIREALSGGREFVRLAVPQVDGKTIALVHEKGHVLRKRYLDGNVLLDAKLPPGLRRAVEKYIRR